MNPSFFNLIVVLGPTASGKTELGVALAREYNGEIISADSRQVYRGLNLGAGKDLQVYTAGGAPVPYHLIDIADLAEEFSVFDFQQHFVRVFNELMQRKVLPVLVGGTGLYLESVLQPYPLVKAPENPALRAELADLSQEELIARLRSLKGRLHNRTDLEERSRLIRAIEIETYSQTHAPEPFPEIHPLILGTRWPRNDLRERIAHRLSVRLEAGMVEEVTELHQAGVAWERLERLGLEYRFITEFLQGRITTRGELYDRLFLAICDFAKRQETWFRRMERQGLRIHWIERADFAEARKLAVSFITASP